MTSASTSRDDSVANAGPLLDSIDAVYFLLFPDWEKELRGNRWNYAVRWARRKPVVLVNPVQARGGGTSLAEPRIRNTRILRVQAAGALTRAAAQAQAGQVLADMAENRVSRPLLWCYNPMLADAYARVPAAARIYHATEAHFATPGLPETFLSRLDAAVTISDLTIAVSEGVATGLRARLPDAPVVTVSNGCDFTTYSTGRPDPELVAARRGFERVAIYAGNVNWRVDFRLLARLVGDHPRTLFALYGPAAGLSHRDSAAWRDITKRNNVHAPGAVDADRLPDLYAAADVGLIPYRDDPLLVEYGLPLKALEMCAGGLPVVSSHMKALEGLAAGLLVARTADEFVAGFEATSRATLSAADEAELRRVSAANDYDRKFDEVLSAVESRVAPGPATTRVDALIEAMGPGGRADEVEFAAWVADRIGRRLARRVASAPARLVPPAVKRRLRRG